MEEEDDKTLFRMGDSEQDIELATDVNDYFPAALIVGTRRAIAGGNTKREMLSAIISTL